MNTSLSASRYIGAELICFVEDQVTSTSCTYQNLHFQILEVLS